MKRLILNCSFILLVLLSCNKDDEDTLHKNSDIGEKKGFIEDNATNEFIEHDHYFDFISNSDGIVFVSDETGNHFISYEEIELPNGSCYFEMDNKSYSAGYAFWIDLSSYFYYYGTEIVIIDRNFNYALDIVIYPDYNNITVGSLYNAEAYFINLENDYNYYVEADYAFVKFLKTDDEKLSGKFEFYYYGSGTPGSGIQSDSKTIKGTFYYLTRYDF